MYGLYGATIGKTYVLSNRRRFVDPIVVGVIRRQFRRTENGHGRFFYLFSFRRCRGTYKVVRHTTRSRIRSIARVREPVIIDINGGFRVKVTLISPIGIRA